jgi:hypothetical protein
MLTMRLGSSHRLEPSAAVAGRVYGAHDRADQCTRLAITVKLDERIETILALKRAKEWNIRPPEFGATNPPIERR